MTSAATKSHEGRLGRLLAAAAQRRVELLTAGVVFFCCAYFFQGGGWNQNAHFVTVVSVVENGTLRVDPFRASTGDLARAPGGLVSAKPFGTALFSLPGFVAAKFLTAGIDNPTHQRIAQAYLTTLFGSGLALSLFALLLFRVSCRRLTPRDALLICLAGSLATPLWPFSTMLNSTPFVALFALFSYALLEAPRLGMGRLGRRRLFLAGLAAGLPTAFEYATALIVLPLAVYAWWQLTAKRRWGVFLAGVATAMLLPLAHQYWVFGNPFHVGYQSLTMPGFANMAARGFFGFERFSGSRLYDLTLGSTRGYFFVSPFLIAAVPGLLRMVRSPKHRPEGLVSGSIAWLSVGLVACLAYWHSGWAITSRYAILFVVFSVIPLIAIFPHHRRWILLGVAVGFAAMFLSTAVTATPPPAKKPPQMTIVGWLWDQFWAGKVAFRNESVLTIAGVPAPPSTWRTSFNLGQTVGLSGKASVLPLFVVITGAFWKLFQWTADKHRHSTSDRGPIGQPELYPRPRGSREAGENTADKANQQSTNRLSTAPAAGEKTSCRPDGQKTDSDER